MASGNFVDVLTSETSSRVDKPCNALALKIRGRIKLNGLGGQLLAASGIANTLSNKEAVDADPTS